jgi:large conductance mechanosensitive channel
MLEEFKRFALRGNVLDMAVGIVVGAGFKDVVSAFTNGVMMPPIGMLVRGVDFSNLFVTLSGGRFDSLAAAEEAGAPVIAYGSFINTVIDFLIIAFAVFLLVKGVNALQRKEEAKPTPPARQEVLLEEIRDLLQARGS